MSTAIACSIGNSWSIAPSRVWMEQPCWQITGPGSPRNSAILTVPGNIRPEASTTTTPSSRSFVTAERMRSLRSHGMVRDPSAFRISELAFDGEVPNPWYYEMDTPGLNYRIPDVLCALGTSQLKKLDKFAARRRQLVALYDQAIENLAPHVKPLSRTPNNTPAWHLYIALIDFDALGADRAAVMRRLQLKGIGTQVHYLPVYRQPYYREMEPDLTLHGADEYYRRTLSLPLFPSMSDEDPARVIDALQQALTS